MRAWAVLALASLLHGGLGCAGDGARRQKADHYFRYCSFEVPVNDHVTLRWPKRKMPLRVHLPKPPAEFVANPEAVYDSVRDGITDWTDVAAPGLPSFTFVDDQGDADIPIVWARTNLGGWYVAHAVYDIDPLARRFGIARILVTARGENGREPTLHVLYETMLHEMGHALGLGHSPERSDVMFPNIQSTRPEGLSARDRETLRLLYARPNGHRVTGARSVD